MIRRAYLRRIEDRLESIDREIDILRAKREKAAVDLRPRYEEETRALALKRESAGEAIRRIREADAASWGKFKGGAEKAVEDLRAAVSEASLRLRTLAGTAPRADGNAGSEPH